MSGNTPDSPVPTEITLHQKSRKLELAYADGRRFEIPYEMLRVYSPSAEVRGHGPGQEVLQTGKKNVDITSMEPTGNYGIQPSFSDGHNSGIYSWEYLFNLGASRERLWAQYLAKLKAAGGSRDT